MLDGHMRPLVTDVLKHGWLLAGTIQNYTKKFNKNTYHRIFIESRTYTMLDARLPPLIITNIIFGHADILVACMGGVLLAGVIIGLASAGLLGAFSALFAV